MHTIEQSNTGTIWQKLRKIVSFQKNSIMAYHNLKKQRKNQVNNMMTREILVLIADDIQKVSIQFNESQQQLANFAEANKTLKYLVEARNKKITALEKTVKALDKKKIRGIRRSMTTEIQMLIIERPSHL